MRRTAWLEAIAVVRAVERCGVDNDPLACDDAEAIVNGSEDRGALVAALAMLARHFAEQSVGEGHVHAALDALVAQEIAR